MPDGLVVHHGYLAIAQWIDSGAGSAEILGIVAKSVVNTRSSSRLLQEPVQRLATGSQRWIILSRLLRNWQESLWQQLANHPQRTQPVIKGKNFAYEGVSQARSLHAALWTRVSKSAREGLSSP